MVTDLLRGAVPRFLSLAVALGFLVIGSGCSGVGSRSANGLLYTHVRIPFSRDLNRTPVMGNESNGKVIRIKEPFTGYGMYTELNTNAIGDIAHKYDLCEIYYTDVEIVSVLGIWKQEKVFIYGPPCPRKGEEGAGVKK